MPQGGNIDMLDLDAILRRLWGGSFRRYKLYKGIVSMSMINRILLPMMVFCFASAQTPETIGQTSPSDNVPAHQVDQVPVAAANAAQAHVVFDPAMFKDTQDSAIDMFRIAEQRTAALRARLFDLLPEQTREAIQEAKERYQDVVLNCNLGDCLISSGTKLKIVFKQDPAMFQGILGVQLYEQVISGADILLASLNDGSFNALLPQSSFSGMTVPLINPSDVGGLIKKLEQQQEVQASVAHSAFTIDQARRLRKLFAEVWDLLGKSHYDPKALAIRQEFYFLSLVLSAVEKQDVHVLIKQCVARIKPGIDAALYLLDEATAKMAEYSELSAKDPNKDLKRAIRYWNAELRRYARSLRLFLSVEKRIHTSSMSPDQFQKLFSVVAQLYSNFGTEFIRLYKEDQALVRDANRWWLATALDWTLSSSLAAWYFSHTQEEFLSSFLQMMVIDKSIGMSSLGGGGMGAFPSADQMVGKFSMGNPLMLSSIMGSAAAVPVLFDPTKWSMQWPTTAKVSSKAAVAFIYYNIFKGSLMDPSWEPTDKGIRDAVLFAINTGKYHVVQWLQNALRYRQPALWEEVRKKTLGIVKPELLGEVVDAFMPAILLNMNEARGPAKFMRRDLYGYDYQLEAPWDGFAPAGDALGYYPNWLIDYDYRYIQRQLFFYVMGSVGEHVGRRIANNKKSLFGEKVGNFCGRCFQGMVVRGWIDADTYEEFSGIEEEFELGIDENIDLLQELFFDPKSQIRKLVVWHLNNQRQIDIRGQDEEKINKQMVAKFLHQLSIMGMIDATDVVKINGLYEKNPKENLRGALLMLKDVLKKRFIGTIGSKVGYGAMSLLAWMAWKSYITQYPLQPV